MTLGESLSAISIIVAILVGIISWVVSAILTKKSIQKKRLQYEIRMHSIVPKEILKNHKSLEIQYNGNVLPEPVLLTLDITNTGNVAIEQPPIEIETVGATYLIPGHIEDIPVGYEEKWKLKRDDAELCKVEIEHINPGQTLKAVFFLDEYPAQFPVFKCPMKDLEIKKVDTELKDVLLATDLTLFTPLQNLKVIVYLLRRIYKK